MSQSLSTTFAERPAARATPAGLIDQCSGVSPCVVALEQVESERVAGRQRGAVVRGAGRRVPDERRSMTTAGVPPDTAAAATLTLAPRSICAAGRSTHVR